MLGRIPRSYASVAYDSLWLAALTENATVPKMMMPNDVNFLKKTFAHIADSYSGITGNTALNAAGDRAYGNYDFWAIQQGNNDNSLMNILVYARMHNYIKEENTQFSFFSFSSTS
jgi:ABC-type branched-subunit amino acid transport system substrate-binding protein